MAKELLHIDGEKLQLVDRHFLARRHLGCLCWLDCVGAAILAIRMQVLGTDFHDVVTVLCQYG